MSPDGRPEWPEGPGGSGGSGGSGKSGGPGGTGKPDDLDPTEIHERVEPPDVEVDEAGLTEEFDSLEHQFSDEFDELADEGVYPGDRHPTTEESATAPAAPNPDESETPPSEFDFGETAEPDPAADEPPAADAGSSASPEDDEADASPADGEVAAGEVKDAAGADEAKDAAGATGPDEDGTPAADADPDDVPDPDDSVDTAQATIESNTLALVDREAQIEAAQEAAHAGLEARATDTASHAVPPEPVTPPPPPGAVTGTLAALGSGPPPDVGKAPKKRFGWRFAAASVVIVATVCAVGVIQALLFANDIVAGITEDDPFRNSVKDKIESVDGGDPQTILILGSDIRSGAGNGLSDTAMLIRVDPDKNLINVFSLPRDMRVNIPGYGTNKLNAAYSFGGPALALETIRKLVGIPINHVVNVDFEGFKDIVDAIGCVYVDIDQHYYHSNEGLYGDQLYMEIDIPAGYAKLCGYRALQYVRYRHTDDDLVRAARQQDFLREARAQITPYELWTDREQLIETFTDYTEADIDSVPELFALLKTFISVRDAQVRQIKFDAGFEDTYVVPTDLEKNVKQFLGEDQPPEPEDVEEEPEPGKSGDEKKPSSGGSPAPAETPMEDASDTGLQVANAIAADKQLKIPIFYPTKVVPGSSISTEQSHSLPVEGPGDPEDANVYRTYKFVMPYQTDRYLEYYGVSGIDWPDAPILNSPTETKTIGGREYMLFWAGGDLRLVGWKTQDGAYWVTNTLTHALTPKQMLAVAQSLTRLEG